MWLLRKSLTLLWCWERDEMFFLQVSESSWKICFCSIYKSRRNLRHPRKQSGSTNPNSKTFFRWLNERSSNVLVTQARHTRRRAGAGSRMHFRWPFECCWQSRTWSQWGSRFESLKMTVWMRHQSCDKKILQINEKSAVLKSSRWQSGNIVVIQEADIGCENNNFQDLKFPEGLNMPSQASDDRISGCTSPFLY